MKNGFFLLYDRTAHCYTIGERYWTGITHAVQGNYCWQILGEVSMMTDADIEKKYRVLDQIIVPVEEVK